MHNSPAIRGTMIAALTLLPLSLLITYGLLSAGATYTAELMAAETDSVLSINVLLKALLAGAGGLLLMYLLRPLATLTLERKPLLGLSLTLSTALLVILWHYVAPFAGQATEFIYHRLAAGVTAALIAVLVCIEVSIVLMSRLAAKATADKPAGGKQADGKQDYRLMRPAIFIFLFGIDLSMAFIPLYMGQMDHELFGLSRDIVMGLPISVEFFFVGVAILLAGVWFDKRGWQEPFYVGLALAAIGACYSWLAPDALHFILSRGLVGFGYGLVQLSSHGFVIRNTDKTTKGQGMAHLAAGLYAGSICGAATGAVIAERFGYEVVFLSGVLVIMSVAIYSLLMFGYREPVAETAEAAVEPAAKPAETAVPGRSALSQFLLDRRVLAAIFFSSMPASIAVVGFLNYFSPVYLNSEGIADSTIGQVLMLFGICLALLGPRIGKLIDATEQKQYLVIIGSLIGAVSFLTFSIWDGLTATVIAIVLLGLSNCLVLSAQSVYLLRLDVTQQLGEGKALGIFRATSRIGQMLGPVVFAWLFVFQEVRFGVAWLGVAYIVMAVIFFLMVQSKSSRVQELQEEAL